MLVVGCWLLVVGCWCWYRYFTNLFLEGSLTERDSSLSVTQGIILSPTMSLCSFLLLWFFEWRRSEGRENFGANTTISNFFNVRFIKSNLDAFSWPKCSGGANFPPLQTSFTRYSNSFWREGNPFYRPKICLFAFWWVSFRPQLQR